MEGLKTMRGGTGGKPGYLNVTVKQNYSFFLMGTLDGELVVPTDKSSGTATQKFDKGRPFFAKLYGETSSKSLEMDYIIDPGDETEITLSTSGMTLNYTAGVRRVIKVGSDNDTPHAPEVIK